MVIYLNENMITAAKKTKAPRNKSAMGYGRKIPTEFMVKLDSGAAFLPWRRIYAICYGNAASYYVNCGACGERFLDGACFEKIFDLNARGATHDAN